MLGIVLIAAGLILAYAVNDSINAVDLHLIGVILFVVGIVELLFELMFFGWFKRRFDREDQW